MDMDAQWMKRCFDLARLGEGKVSPNPMVGAVIVFQNRIIGEGWHQQYGQAHAEVNAIHSVAEADRRFLPDATLYCSLEPCHHFGKTPPCVDLVLEQRIPKVVVSNLDPNPLVAGQSVQKLRANGVEVLTGILEVEGAWLNRAFFTHITLGRPYIILKWAQSSDGYLARPGERTHISGPLTQRLVHRWRAGADSILVGTTTARVDNPRLDQRYWLPEMTNIQQEKQLLRIVLDFQGTLDPALHLFDGSAPTLVVGKKRPFQANGIATIEASGENWIPVLLNYLLENKRPILLVEGGSQVLQQFLDTDCWDEIRVITNPKHLNNGVSAPILPKKAYKSEQYQVQEDQVAIWVKSV